MSGELNTYVLIQQGTVLNIILWDGNANPDEGGLAVAEGETLALLLAGQNPVIGLGATQDDNGTWTYEQPPARVLTSAEILAANTSVRDDLLNAAGRAIAPLQDALDLEIIKPAEQTLLTQWKTYRVGVNRVDLTQANPSWPTPPVPLDYVGSNPSA